MNLEERLHNLFVLLADPSLAASRRDDLEAECSRLLAKKTTTPRDPVGAGERWCTKHFRTHPLDADHWNISPKDPQGLSYQCRCDTYGQPKPRRWARGTYKAISAQPAASAVSTIKLPAKLVNKARRAYGVTIYSDGQNWIVKQGKYHKYGADPRRDTMIDHGEASFETEAAAQRHFLLCLLVAKELRQTKNLEWTAAMNRLRQEAAATAATLDPLVALARSRMDA